MIRTLFLYLFFFTLPALCTDKYILLKNNAHVFFIPIHVARTSEVLKKRSTPLYSLQNIPQNYWHDINEPWDITELMLPNEEIEYFIIALRICMQYTNSNKKLHYSCKNNSLFPTKSPLIKKEILKKLSTLSKNFSFQSFLNIYTLCTYFITPILRHIVEKKMYTELFKNPECSLQWPFIFDSENNIRQHTLKQAHKHNSLFLLPYTNIQKISSLPLKKISGSYCSLSPVHTTNLYILCDTQGNRYQLNCTTGEQTLIHTPSFGQNLYNHQQNDDMTLTIEEHGTLKLTRKKQTILENIEVLGAALHEKGHYSYETVDHNLVISLKNNQSYTYKISPYHNLFFKGTSTHHTLSADGLTVCILQKYFYPEPGFLHGVGEVLLQYHARHKTLKKIFIKKKLNPTQTLIINDQGSAAIMFRKGLYDNENYIHYLDLNTEKEMYIALPDCTEPILAASYNQNTQQLILLHATSLSIWDISCPNFQSKDITFLLLCEKDPFFYQKYSHIPWVATCYKNQSQEIQEKLDPAPNSSCSLL